jgi:hypothetical protein
MQVLTYDCPNSDDKQKELEKLRLAHEIYVNIHSSKAGGKLNAHLLSSIEKIAKMGLPKHDLSYFFDDATAADLEKFARNDPWVKAGLIKAWDLQPEVEVDDPIQMLKMDQRENMTIKVGSH